MQSSLRQRLLTSTVVFGAIGLAAPAYAQPADQDTQEVGITAQADADEGTGTQSIVVTGSRIQRRDLTSTSPLAVVQDEEFKLSGAVNVEQVLNTLPQVIPGTTAFSNNPGGGVATLNLRNLGSTRTLVLVNGRRWMFFDTGQVVDLNTIPSFLIDSVDVVTGGASAVYGSDALTGVVNFRLRTDLDGFEAGSSYSITEEGDGARFNAYAAMGSQFADGRGNVTVFGEYYKRRSIFQGDRDFSRVALGDSATGLAPGGSATTPQGRIAIAATANIPAGNGLPAVTLPRAAGNFGGLGANFTLPGVSRPFLNPADSYNYAPANYLMVPQERWLLGGYGEYEISDAVTAFTEVTFVNNRVQNELAATPVTGNFNVNVAQQQQFLSAADFAALQQIDVNEALIDQARVARGLAPQFGGDVNGDGVINAADADGSVLLGVNRRILETGARNQFDDRNAFRALVGVRGPAFGDWTYEAYYSYARTRNAQIQNGNISRSLFQAGLDGTGTPVNPFGPNTISPDALTAITILSQNTDISILQVANASLAGSLGNLGFGADDIGLAVGTEYRKVSSSFVPDTALSSGDVIGFNAGLPTSGGYDIKEVYGELRVPIISDGFIYRLELNGAFRYSDYSLAGVGGVETYSGGFEFAPIRDITFRGQYQRAVRAPNVGELFGGASIGFPPATDPCALASAATDATIRQLCIQTGVPAAAVGTGTSLQPNPQIQGRFGGNPNLGEETADTYTIGAIIRPSFIPRLNISVDYFDIKIEDTISTLGGGLANTLNLCYNVIQDINSIYCQAVTRDPSTGIIGDDFTPQILNANIGGLTAKGIDFQVDYSVPLGFSMMGSGESRLNFFFLGTWTEEALVIPVQELSDLSTDCAGRFGISACGSPQPEFKWTSRLSLIDGPMTASLRWRHLDSVRDDDDATDYVVERIGSYDIFDLSFAYDVSDEMSFTVGVNNLFDKYPQLVGTNQEQGNTYPGTYDVLGRDFFVSANFRF